MTEEQILFGCLSAWNNQSYLPIPSINVDKRMLQIRYLGITQQQIK